MTETFDVATVAWQFVSPRRFTARLVFRGGLVSPPSCVVEPTQEGSFIPEGSELPDGHGVFVYDGVPSVALAHGNRVVDYIATLLSRSKDQYKEIKGMTVPVEGHDTLTLMHAPTGEVLPARPIIFMEGHDVTEIPIGALGEQFGG